MKLPVSKDTVISYLPFFGRGYIAPISPSDVDFDFTSTKFTNTTTTANRGWNVSIKPKDQTYLRELYFRIFDNASASLNITSLDRSSISFEGYITERKSKAASKKIVKQIRLSIYLLKPFLLSEPLVNNSCNNCHYNQHYRIVTFCKNYMGYKSQKMRLIRSDKK
ncbi:MAG: DUF4251 domain-containing protein [Chitinophagaceae bacterium]